MKLGPGVVTPSIHTFNISTPDLSAHHSYIGTPPYTTKTSL